jgi:hypothetical protein
MKATRAEKIRLWHDHPAAMVRELFGVEPDPWQEEVLEAFPHKQRIAMPAAKGVGKTTCLTWIAWNFLLTRKNAKCAATSISGDNLRDNFWTEMAKWQQMAPILKGAFTWTKERIFANENPEQWWLSSRTYTQSGDATQQANTLAGLHADYILFLIDESGGMSDAVMVSADAALSSCKEGHIVQAGNPTALGGPLYRAVQNENNLWHVVRISSDPDDPNRSNRMSIEWARQFIEEYGRDSDWTRVNVFGLFPRSGFNALIGPEEVRAAMKRAYREYDIGPVAKVMGIDVARYGDDSSVISKRQGIQAYTFISHRALDSVAGAAIVNREWFSWEADAVFIDDTGGFGSGWLDQLRLLGRAPIGVHFAAKPHERQRYENKRAEMYQNMVDWIKAGGALPEDRELLEDLTNTTYSAPKGVLILEPKELVKAKQLGRSPDKADALALTFAEPVLPVAKERRRPQGLAQPYKPFAEMDRASETSYGPVGYSPYREPY